MTAMGITIDRLQESDLDEVMRIEQVSFRYPWRRQFFAADLNRPASLLLAARQDGHPVAYAVAWQAEDELHLANIAVDPLLRHQGVGSQLLRALLESGKEAGCGRIYLEVRVSNLIAQSFYRKHGFFPTYTRRAYYPDKEDALIFEREL